MASPSDHRTVFFDVHDAKVYSLTDDAGASPTYGAAVDVPGIAEVGLDPNLITAELKGDARVLAKKGRVDRMNLTATYGKLSLDVLEVIIGGTVTDGAPSANDAQWELLGDNELPYFAFRFKIEDLETGIGDLHVTLWKCQLTGGTLLGSSTDNFGQPTLTLEAISTESDDKMIRVDLLETETALPA